MVNGNVGNLDHKLRQGNKLASKDSSIAHSSTEMSRTVGVEFCVDVLSQ